MALDRKKVIPELSRLEILNFGFILDELSNFIKEYTEEGIASSIPVSNHTAMLNQADSCTVAIHKING